MTDSSREMESIEDFRVRARAWIRDNLERRSAGAPAPERAERRELDRALQRKIYDAGFAGLAVPAEYGGAGLTLDHQKVWAEETADFITPSGYMVSIGMMLPTLLDHGTEVVKQRHIPRMLSGEETWIQLLSEPGGGSDMASAMTKATREGDAYVINGSKMWSSGAGWSNYGICLARVDWNAPKHQGLAMFAIPLDADGVTIDPIIPVTGPPAHFFTEYFDDVRVPVEYRLDEEGEGWTVAQRLLFHERNATAGVGYGYGLGGGSSDDGWQKDVARLAREHAALDDEASADLVAEDVIRSTVSRQLKDRINAGMRTGKLQGHWGSLLKLGMGADTPINAEAVLAVSGADGVIWVEGEDGGEPGLNWLRCRGVSIAGGSNEIQRNIVSERLLDLPREPGDDKTLPFNEVLARRQRQR